VQRYTLETRWVDKDGSVTVLHTGDRDKVGAGKPKLESLDLPDATPQGEIQEVEKKRTPLDPIEKWVSVVEGLPRKSDHMDASLAVPNLLNWVAEMEPMPPPSQCGGVDYPAIYRYLALLCQGEAPPDLSPASTLRVASLLPHLTQLIEGVDLTKETQYLSNYRGPFTKYRYEDSFNFGTKDVRDVEELSKVPGMNPLGFHPEMLVHRHLPPLEDPKEEEGGMTNNQG